VLKVKAENDCSVMVLGHADYFIKVWGKMHHFHIFQKEEMQRYI
jgi:hypothetical protein